MSNSGEYTIHFNALFYSMVQLFFGKELYVDFPNQYGLYPYILEPIFRLVGLSVLNFTLIMSILLAVAFFSLYIFTIKIVDNKILASIGFIGILFCNYLFEKIQVGYSDSYFQYFPLRILLPSLIVLTAYLYFKDKNVNFYYLSLFIGILSMFWNFESGLIVFLTWADRFGLSGNSGESYRVGINSDTKTYRYKYIFSFDYNNCIYHIYIRFGSYSLLSNLIEYQQIFYSSGFAMLPMRLIHPWNIVILIYFIGIAHSAKYLIVRNNSIRTKMIFFLSLLGVGVMI